MNNEFRKFDEPVSAPDSDLLGAVPYARNLAKFIERTEPPFTLGIYGEWGTGKTSFVRLIQHFLYLHETLKKIEALNLKFKVPLKDSLLDDLLMLRGLEKEKANSQAKLLVSKLTNEYGLDEANAGSIIEIAKKDPVQFIYFSAWPYTTSDNIWRALVLEITKSLYQKVSSQKKPAETTPKTFHAMLRKFLSSDMILFGTTPPPKDPLENYNSILSSLDNTAYGSISKDATLQYQFNHEIALTSIVEGALKVMGSISPLVRLFQGFFGIEFKSDLANVFQKEKNTATRKVVESIEKFRELLQKIFKEREEQTPVFIFVDDLDRCLPDVALDILEAIKIFLNEIPCVFIVAADDNLIGQGLRLRYNELFGNVDKEKMDAFLAVKGQEYFEKIIQFGIKVPSKNTTQLHSFIAAQFPKWMPATDIIQTAVGANPRRLKQYCNRLTYSFMVHEITSMQTENEKAGQRAKEMEVLDKMVQIFAWSPDCSHELGKIAGGMKIDSFKKEMDILEDWLSRITLENSQEEVPVHACEIICRYIADISPLVGVFKAAPAFSNLDPLWIATFSQLADIRPLQEGKLVTSDATFIRIYETSKGVFSGKKMMIDNLARLISFFEMDKEFFQTEEWYFKLAGSGNWSKGMKKLEEIFENAQTFLESDLEIVGYPADMAPIIEEIKLLRTTDKGNDFLSKTLKDQLIKAPKLSSILPGEVLYFKKASEIGLPDIKDLLNVQFQNTTAEEIKTYKKAEELFNRWNDGQREAIIESLDLRFNTVQHFQHLRSISKLDGLDYKWPELAQQTRVNGRLFLKDLEAGPQDDAFKSNPASEQYLKDEVLRRFLSMRPLFREIPETTVNQYLAVSQITAKAMPVEEQTTPVVKATSALTIDKQSFHLLVIIIKKVNSEPTDLLHDISIKYKDDKKDDKIPIDVENILATLGNISFARTTTSGVTRQYTVFDPSIFITPEVFGSRLLENLLGHGQVRELFDMAMNSGDKIRLVFQLINDNLFPIPLELLYLEQQKTFLSITQRISLVRFLNPLQTSPPREFDSPVKILVAIARPTDVPYLEYDQERTIIENTVKDASADKQVELLVVDHASLEILQRKFRSFEPHIFHFIGHGVKGALVLEDEEGKSKFLDTDQLSVLLDSYKINIAFLNACDTASTLNSDVGTGIAGRLIEKGIPAVIASTKPVLDETALMFTKELYQALFEGFSLETAMSEARKALWFEQLAWYPYILFTSTTALDNFRLKITTKREGESAVSSAIDLSRH